MTTRYITHAGETLSMREWSRRLGGSQLVVLRRLRQGWSEADAVTVPVRAMPAPSESMAAIGRALGGRDGLVSDRIRLGWSREDATTKPTTRKRVPCTNCGARCDRVTCAACTRALKPRERRVRVDVYAYPDAQREPRKRGPRVVDAAAHPRLAAVWAKYRVRKVAA